MLVIDLFKNSTNGQIHKHINIKILTFWIVFLKDQTWAWCLSITVAQKIDKVLKKWKFPCRIRKDLERKIPCRIGSSFFNDFNILDSSFKNHQWILAFHSEGIHKIRWHWQARGEGGLVSQMLTCQRREGGNVKILKILTT